MCGCFSPFILFILLFFYSFFFSCLFFLPASRSGNAGKTGCVCSVCGGPPTGLNLDYIMVSMVDHSDMVMDSIVPKHEPGPDGSISSAVSTPDPEAEPLTQDAAQTQKRKGGRKPVRNIFSNLGPRIPLCYCPISLSFQRCIQCCILTRSDICHLGRAKAAQPAGPGGLPRTQDRVYPSARDHHQTQ